MCPSDRVICGSMLQTMDPSSPTVSIKESIRCRYTTLKKKHIEKNPHDEKPHDMFTVE